MNNRSGGVLRRLLEGMVQRIAEARADHAVPPYSCYDIKYDIKNDFFRSGVTINVNQWTWLGKISWIDGLVAAVILLLFFVAAFVISKYLPKLVAMISSISKNQIDEALITAFRKPIVLILIVTGIYLSLRYLPLPANWRHAIALLYKSAATLAIGWGFYLLSGAIGVFFNHMGDRFDLQFNTIVIPFLSRIAKFLVIVFTAFMVLDQWNYHVTGLITGLGIGGLAVAMAAKDTLSNLFGGFVIITDAPFTIGELIQCGSIEGFVEDINFRSTRIRTLDQALVTVPNSTLANRPITNLSRMNKRRIYFNIPLDLETTGRQLDACIAALRKRLATDPDVDPQNIMVYLDNITSTGINLMIQFYVKTTDVEKWFKLKEKFNFDILKLLNEFSIDLATTRSQMVFDRQTLSGPKAPAGKTVAPEREHKRQTGDNH
ncbi:MAG: mechanosensitive ion channel family protein [Sporolactobacillus sp.]|nr:mechanosensitive ion channel family protein [Sporolactobacillus sp.]